MKLFLTFSPKYKRYKKGIHSEPSTPRGFSSNSKKSDKEFGEVKLESSDDLGYISDTPIIYKTKSLSSKFEETDQKVLYETPSQFLDSAIQTVSIEPQGSLETDFQTTLTNLFPNFNQVVSEDFITSSNLPIHFGSLTGQISLVDWHKENTTPEKDVVRSFPFSSSDITSSTSNSEGFCGKKVEPSSKKTLEPSKSNKPLPKPPPKPPPLPPNPVSSRTVPMTTPRVLNVAPYPLYHGHMGTDPDRHVDRFVVVAHANQVSKNLYLFTFPSTLIEVAADWYAQVLVPFAIWNALRDAFLEWFRPRSFIPGLIDRMGTIKMGVNEGIDSYYTRFSILLQKWRDNNLPDNYLVSTFIRGVWPNALRIFLREQNLADSSAAYTLAKNWEEAQVNANFAQFEDPDLYPVGRNRYDVIPRLDSYGRNLYAPVSNNPLIIEGPPPIPVMNPKPLAIRELVDPVMDSISKLEEKFTELAVQVTAGRDKRPKPTNQRTNVWCSNCKGHGHLPTECPTPLGTNIQNNSCIFCD